MDTSKCAWKLVPADKFVLGQDADRCGETAAVKILRPYRKTDLYLCEFHLNSFINEWGLHNEVEILCFNWLVGTNGRICVECGNPALLWEDGYAICEPCARKRIGGVYT